MSRCGAVLGGVLFAALLVGCTDNDDAPVAEPPAQTPPEATTAPTEPPTSAPPDSSASPRRVSPDDARVRIALDAIDHLAGRIGPRPGTSPAYFRAADWVQRRFEESGWDVGRQRFPTPAGVSWGVPVPAGPSVNLIATRGDVEPGRPWLLVGAHLDTVPRAPGAEDNASGVGVLLAIADALDGRRTRLPVVLVAFGSEEPRGEGDDDHHYGSRAFVAEMTPQQRRSLRGMVSMDRVGVGEVLPVKSVSEPSIRAELVGAAARAGVETVLETGHSSSDHESFVDEGLPGVRLGGTSFAGYHTPADVPSVIDRDQLERTARTVLAWLR